MKIAVVEDEILLAEELSDMITSLDSSYEVVAKLQSIEDAVDWFQANSCDLIFMDIQLSDGLSFSIFEKLEIEIPVIFTTAYDEYAIQAFTVNSIGYILKPIKKEEVNKAIHKYQSLTNNYKQILKSAVQDNSYKTKLTLSQGDRKITVDASEIVYFRADGRYVFAHLNPRGKYFCEYTLRELEEIIDPNLFFRINRTFILNKYFLNEFKHSSDGRISINLKLEFYNEFIVSRPKVNDFVEWLQQ